MRSTANVFRYRVGNLLSGIQEQEREIITGRIKELRQYQLQPVIIRA